MYRCVKKWQILTEVFILLLLTSCDYYSIPPFTSNTWVSNISSIGVTAKSRIILEGDAEIKECGFCWNTMGSPTKDDFYIESEVVNDIVTCRLLDLSGGTKYYIRSYAKSKAGIFYGEVKSFYTIAYKLPVVSTPAVSDIGYNSVECSLGGIVSDNTYNVITKGVCWSTSINPTVDDEKIDLGPGFGGLACNIKGLDPGTVYYIRGYGTNSLGTTYGYNQPIRTFDGYMTDYEGYEYNTVRLGNQEWMAKSLRTKHFMNGDLISSTYPLTLNIEQEDKPLYQWLLSGNEDFSKNYERKYTWYTATDSRSICPTGWHLPSISEWNELLDHLGGEELTAELFRRSYHWGWGDLRNTRPYEGSFCASASGYREVTGQYRNSNYGTYWWSGTESSSGNVYAIYSGYYDFEIVMQTERDKKYGFSIRCIKD